MMRCFLKSVDAGGDLGGVFFRADVGDGVLSSRGEGEGELS